MLLQYTGRLLPEYVAKKSQKMAQFRFLDICHYVHLINTVQDEFFHAHEI
jgi:hypothetical protein